MKYPILLLLLLSVVASHSSAAHRVPYLSKPALSIQGAGQESPCACDFTESQAQKIQKIQLADKGISDQQAAAIAKRAHGGSVINVARKGKVYLVRLVKDGRVRSVKVDAVTGKIVK